MFSYLRPILLLFTVFTATSASCGELTSSDILRRLDQIAQNSSNSDRNNAILEHIQSNEPIKFSTDEEHIQFLKSLNKYLLEDEAGYPELLFFTGSELQRLRQFLDAYPLLYKLRILIDESHQKFDFECDFYEVMGHSYFFFRRYPDAEIMFRKGISCEGVAESARINMFNTLGLIYRDLNQPDKAEEQFRKAIRIAREIDDEAWFGVLSGNLGLMHYQKGDFSKAIEYCSRDYEISLRKEQFGSAIQALCLLLRIDVNQNRFTAASKKIETLDSLLLFAGIPDSKLAYYRAKTDFLEKTGKFEEALDSYRMFRNFQDTLAKQRNLVNFNNTEFQIQFERKQAEIRVLEQTRKTDRISILSLLVLLLTILIGAFVIIKQIGKRRKKEKELLELKNQQIEFELQRAESELREVVKNLIEKNTALQDLSMEIEKIQHDQNDTSQAENQQLEERLQSFTLLTEENWVEFKRLFEKLFPGFFDHFQSKYAEITNAEIRLAALIKLNLENLEMAKVLGISPDSVRKTNLRLRKKLQIEDQKELQQLIQSI